MSKAAGKMKMLKKSLRKVDHSRKLRVNIPAGLASPAPPLGQQLGQRNINIGAFCKDFNQRTAHIKEGIPLPVRVKVNFDRSYELIIHQPPALYFLRQAAGIQKGTIKGETAGKITLKHLYEIAKIKSQDPPLELMSLQQICQMLIGTARGCGIEVVRELDVDEYSEFLTNRQDFLEKFRKSLDEAKEAKKLGSKTAVA